MSVKIYSSTINWVEEMKREEESEAMRKKIFDQKS